MKGLQAGLDLEMPYSGGYNDRQIVKAVQEGRLDEAVLDEGGGAGIELLYLPVKSSIVRKLYLIRKQIIKKQRILRRNVRSC